MEEEPPPGVHLHLRAVALAVGTQDEAVLIANRLVSPVGLPGEADPRVGIIEATVVDSASASAVFPAVLGVGLGATPTPGVLVVGAIPEAKPATVHVYFFRDVTLERNGFYHDIKIIPLSLSTGLFLR